MIGCGSRGHGQRGATQTETVLIVVGVAVAVLVAVTLFGNKISALFGRSTADLDGTKAGGVAPTPEPGAVGPVDPAAGADGAPPQGTPGGTKPSQKPGDGGEPISAVGKAIDDSGAVEPVSKTGQKGSKPDLMDGVTSAVTKGGVSKKGAKPDKDSLLGDLGEKSGPGRGATKTGNRTEKNDGGLDAGDVAGRANALREFNNALREIEEKARRGEPPNPDDLRAVIESLDSALGDRVPPRIKQIVENAAEHLKTAQDAQDLVNALRILADSAARNSNDPVQPLRDLSRFVGALKPLAKKIPGAGDAIGGFLDYYSGSLTQAADTLARVHASRRNPSDIWNETITGSYYLNALAEVEARMEAEGRGLPEPAQRQLQTRPQDPEESRRRTDVANAESRYFRDHDRREHARNEIALAEARSRLIQAAEQVHMAPARLANERMELQSLERELREQTAISRGGGGTAEETLAAVRRLPTIRDQISSTNRRIREHETTVERDRQRLRTANEEYQRRLAPVRAAEEEIARTLQQNRPGDDAWRRENTPRYVPGSNYWGVPSDVQAEVDGLTRGGSGS